jgi:hypothetical protein
MIACFPLLVGYRYKTHSSMLEKQIDAYPIHDEIVNKMREYVGKLRPRYY